ncbi:FHA domain-containing protein, partial [Mycobacterium persicum]|uniref:FHA domain-containing protein n=1 Tax=Mycobacterium persicum TaxID=1487726 RepID=UPI000A0CCAF5
MTKGGGRNVIPNAPPLTVWFGSMRYVFSPGRDVLAGPGEHCDIRLDHPGPGRRTTPDVVLRFQGTHWVAMDGSGNGIFVDGSRLSTVDIRDGQTIAIGDPRRGPRLTFQLASAPAGGGGGGGGGGGRPPPPP